MKRGSPSIRFFLGAARACPGAEMWRSNLDSDAAGVVDIFNNYSGKVMIGPASGGRLRIEAWSNSPDACTPDKAGLMHANSPVGSAAVPTDTSDDCVATDFNGDVDFEDFPTFVGCVNGPNIPMPAGCWE